MGKGVLFSIDLVKLSSCLDGSFLSSSHFHVIEIELINSTHSEINSDERIKETISLIPWPSSCPHHFDASWSFC